MTIGMISSGEVRDEELVRLFKQHRDLAARNNLILRYRREVAEMVACQADTRGLSWQDVEDAQQTAVFWMIEAISQYNADGAGVQNCRFRSFLHMVINRRLIDLARRSRRIFLRDPLYLELAEDDSQEPASRAQHDEDHASLRKAVDKLDRDCRKLWEALLSGRSLRDAGASMGRSYDATKRLRQRLIKHLRRSLRGGKDAGRKAV